MQFRFDANQEYQLRAVEAVADLFDGQSRLETGMTLDDESGVAAVANRLDLDEAALLAHLREVQRGQTLPEDDGLQCLEDRIVTAGGEHLARFPTFSAEMETGSGKTYVYLRTALELSRRYGLRKYIVVVPSIAIREGVLKTMQVTEKRLRELDGVELMVMTIDAFNKASNVIRQSTDRLQGETPIRFIRGVSPDLDHRRATEHGERAAHQGTRPRSTRSWRCATARPTATRTASSTVSRRIRRTANASSSASRSRRW